MILLVLTVFQSTLTADGRRSDRHLLSKRSVIPEEEYFIASNYAGKRPSRAEAKCPSSRRRCMGLSFNELHRRSVRARSEFLYGVSLLKLNSMEGFSRYAEVFFWNLLCGKLLKIIVESHPKRGGAVVQGLLAILKRLMTISQWGRKFCHIILFGTKLVSPCTVFSFIALDIADLAVQVWASCPAWGEAFGSIVVAPVQEEIIFRLVFDRLQKQVCNDMNRLVGSLGPKPAQKKKKSEKQRFDRYESLESWHVVSALLFGCAHIGNYLDESAEPTPMYVGLAVSSATQITARTLSTKIPAYRKGGIMAAVGSHMAWNLFLHLIELFLSL